MLNVKKQNLEKVLPIIPSLKSPTILPLADSDLVAVQAVIPSDEFWEIVDDLKEGGATDILILPIENIIL